MFVEWLKFVEEVRENDLMVVFHPHSNNDLVFHEVIVS